MREVPTPKRKNRKLHQHVEIRCVSTTRKPSKEFFPDPQDIVFYEVALSKEDSFLVTGNMKHYPKVDFVVTPAEMMKIIEKEK